MIRINRINTGTYRIGNFPFRGSYSLPPRMS